MQDRKHAPFALMRRNFNDQVEYKLHDCKDKMITEQNSELLESDKSNFINKLPFECIYNDYQIIIEINMY